MMSELYTTKRQPSTTLRRHYRFLGILLLMPFFIYIIVNSTYLGSTYRMRSLSPLFLPQCPTTTTMDDDSSSGSSNSGKILFLNRHQGTSNDFAHVANSLNLNYTELTPALYTPYGQRSVEARFLNSRASGLGAYICDCYSGRGDSVVVSDTNPDARFLLQRILDGNCNVNRIVMISTNRFDFSVLDVWEYYDLVRNVGSLYSNKVHWIANNFWEPKYASLVLGGEYLKYQVIRPFGRSSLPQAAPVKDSHLPVLVNYDNTVEFANVLRNYGVRFKLLPKKYGGPTVLRQHKAFITIPYQASTMKMYENIAHGVVMLVPTPRFLRILLTQPGYELSGAGTTIMAGKDWYRYIEFYSTDLSQFFYQFDSMEDLSAILQRRTIDVRNVRMNGPKFWETQNHNALVKWGKVFGREYRPQDSQRRRSEL